MSILKLKSLLFFFLGLVTFLFIAATIQPNNSITVNGGIGRTNTFYGATNYFTATDTAANTNGPMVNYRTTGSTGISNLFTDIVVGTTARYSLGVSSTLGDLAYGGFQWQTDHDGSPPSTVNIEIVWSSPRHIAIIPGVGYTGNGHGQLGGYSHLGGYVGQPFSGANTRFFTTEQGQIAQTTATNFSGAITFQTSELQGANYVAHEPGIASYSIRTNAPGRWALAFFTEIVATVNGDVWDPNSYKPNKVFQIQSGDITNALFFKPINYPTNLGTVAIDCSIPVSDQTTGVNITFTSPANFDSTAVQYEHIYQIITNSAAGTITLTAPANARLTGTTTVTRMCQVEWWIKIGKWTNGVVTQWF